MYKEAARKKLRFNTPYGNLTTEQLWNLKLGELDQLAVKLDEANSKVKSFIRTKNPEDKINDLKLKITLDIMQTKMDEAEEQRTAKERKEHNEKVIDIIKRKREAKLEDMSEEELLSLLK